MRNRAYATATTAFFGPPCRSTRRKRACRALFVARLAPAAASITAVGACARSVAVGCHRRSSWPRAVSWKAPECLRPHPVIAQTKAAFLRLPLQA